MFLLSTRGARISNVWASECQAGNLRLFRFFDADAPYNLMANVNCQRTRNTKPVISRAFGASIVDAEAQGINNRSE